jgi:hypothetical protein
MAPWAPGALLREWLPECRNARNASKWREISVNWGVYSLKVGAGLQTSVYLGETAMPRPDVKMRPWIPRIRIASREEVLVSWLVGFL